MIYALFRLDQPRPAIPVANRVRVAGVETDLVVMVKLSIAAKFALGSVQTTFLILLADGVTGPLNSPSTVLAGKMNQRCCSTHILQQYQINRRFHRI